MKIAIYCQHVLGIGHLFRTIEICKAFSKHEVILIIGGPQIEKSLPGHIREFRLPSLQMDTEFKGLYSADPHVSLERLKEKRQAMLLSFFKSEAPDVFIVELYPFGRKAFRFELDPVLSAIRVGRPGGCRVFSSVRDILVEKEDQEKHELRAVNTLNKHFDAVLVHADPSLIGLDRTFYHFDEIDIPVVYTGYVAPKPGADARESLRASLGISRDDLLVVASAGGGSVGQPLLQSALEAFKQLQAEKRKHLFVFSGPYLEDQAYIQLERAAVNGITVEKFTPDFMSYLAAADLSVSMGGYNTTMNILAANVPALIWPFAENQEQRLRVKSLADKAAVRALEDDDLVPDRLAGLMAKMISSGRRSAVQIDLDGAAKTAGWVEDWVERSRNI